MSRSRRDGVFRTIVERRKIFGRLVAQIIATDSPPRVTQSITSVIHPLARALYESRSALLELVGVRLCLSFARVFVLGSKSKFLMISLFFCFSLWLMMMREIYPITC